MGSELEQAKIRVQQALTAGQYEQAYELALAAHTLDRMDGWLIGTVQQCLSILGRADEAIAFMEAQDEWVRDKPEYRLVLAFLRVGNGDFRDVEELQEDYGDSPDASIRLLLNFIVLYYLYRSGQFEAALAFAEKNDFDDVQQADVWFVQAFSALQMDRWSLSQEIATKLEAVSPQDPRTFEIRTQLLIHTGQFESGLTEVAEGLKRSPGMLRLSILHAQCLIGLGKEMLAKQLLVELFEVHVDDPMICLMLADLSQHLFTSGESTASMYLDRCMYLMRGGLPFDIKPRDVIKLLRRNGRELGWFTLQAQLPAARFDGGIEMQDMTRNVLPFLHHQASHTSPWEHGSELANLIISYYLGSTDDCYAGIDDRLMARDDTPSAMQDYYYALTAAQIIEDHSAVAPAALDRAHRTMTSPAAMVTDLYYALLLIAMYDGSDKALTNLTALRSDHRWNALLHLLELRLHSEADPGLLQSPEGASALKDLVDHMHREEGCYFLHPTPVVVPKHGHNILEPLTPLFQFMENLELLSHVTEYVRSFQKDQALNEVYFVRGSIFSRLLVFEAYEEVRALGLVDPDLEGFAPAAVSWVSRQLNSKDEARVNIDGLVQAHQDTPPEELLHKLGGAVFNSINGARHRGDVIPLADALGCVRENYLLCTALHQRGLLDIEQCLLFQHYCQYALEHLVRMDTRAFEKELKGKLDDEVLTLLKQLDIIGSMLELAIGPVRPFYWICSKGIKAITNSMGVTVTDDKLLSYAQYEQFIKERQQREAA